MKNKLLLSLLTLSTLFVLSACQSTTGESLDTITIGASITPHAEILEEIRPLLEEQGYHLEVVEYTDYILPNTSLDAGELDANFFQHAPYLEEFNASNHTQISSAQAVHFEPLGIYSENLSSISELSNGAKIAVPNDTSNEARALLLLEAQGIIKLSPDAGLTATVLDIVENPLGVEIIEIEASQLPRILPDVDLACINGNYALQGGLTANDALAFEESSSIAAQTYANIIAVQTEQLDSDKTKAIVEAITDPSVANFITTNYEGAVVPVY